MRITLYVHDKEQGLVWQFSGFLIQTGNYLSKRTVSIHQCKSSNECRSNVHTNELAFCLLYHLG